MYKFSAHSLQELKGVHPLLAGFCFTLLGYHDFRVVSGVRTFEKQKELYASGASKTLESKHLIQSKSGYGHAVDLLPYINGQPLDPNNVKDIKQWYYFIGLAIGLSHIYLPKYCTLISGADWNHNNNTIDTNFIDLYHFELMYDD